jgi:glycosyltransferase involved in cell wall biosynthesis
MNLLLVVPYLPHEKIPHAGGQVVHQELRHLSKWHRITLVAAAHSSDGIAIQSLRPYCAEIHTVKQTQTIAEKLWRVVQSLPIALLHPSVLKPRIRRSYDLTRTVHRLLREKPFDLIQVEFTDTARFFRRPLPLPSILVAIDVLEKPARRRLESSRGIARWLRKADYRRTVRLEEHIVRLFDRVLTLSKHDADLLARLYPGTSVSVLTYGLTRQTIYKNEPRGKDLLFVGAMERMVNVQSVMFTVEKLLPRLWREFPEITFTIVGGNPAPAVQELSRRDSRIRVMGFVPEVETYLASAYAFVAPLFVGGGIIIKIVEALAAGVPVVTTSVGNEGIEATPGEELLQEETPDGLTEACLKLLRDPGFRDRIGEQGRQFALRKYSWEEATKFLNQQYEELVNARKTKQ